MVKLYFTEYAPDLPSFENPGVTTAKNVIPLGTSYTEFPGLSVYSSNALTAYCRGATFGRDADGNTFNFMGDATKLYLLQAGALTDVSKVGGYTNQADSNWFFTSYSTRMIATNFDDAIQSFVMGSSSVFADLSATAPRARYVGTMPGFVFALNTYDAVNGNVPVRARWCAYLDPTDWTVSATTQAGYYDLDSKNGWIQGFVGGSEYGALFQEYAISRVQYVGSPTIFQFTPVETGRGLLTASAALRVGNFVPYIGNDGFYIFDGSQSIPIGENKVNRTFFADLDTDNVGRICTCADIDKQVIYWAYPGGGNTGGRPNKILMYNYAPNAKLRWAYAEVEIEYMFVSYSEGYTLETLDTLSTDIDALTIPLDSRFYTGNTAILSAINSNHRLAYFTGTPLTAVIETTEAQLIEGSRAFLTLLRAIVEGDSSTTTTVQIGTREALTETVTWGTASSTNSFGNHEFRSNSRFHRARVNISGGFDHAQGVEILEVRNAGVR
jgi:hypothetical protein